MGGDDDSPNGGPGGGSFINDTNATKVLDTALVASIAVAESNSEAKLGDNFLTTYLVPMPAIGAPVPCDGGTAATFVGGDANGDGVFNVGESMVINFDGGDCDVGGVTRTSGKLTIKLVVAGFPPPSFRNSYDYSLAGVNESIGTTQGFSGITGATQSLPAGDVAKNLKFVWNNTGDTITVSSYETKVGKPTKMNAFLESVVLGATGQAKLTLDSADSSSELQVKAPDGSRVFLNCPGGFGAGKYTYSVNGGPSIAYTPPS